MQKDKTTITLNKDEIEKVIKVFSWGLDGYGKEEISDYNDYVDVAQKFVKAKARVLGKKYDKNNYYFVKDDNKEE